MTLNDIIIPWLDFISVRFSEKTNKYYRFLLNKHFSKFFDLNIKKYPLNLFLTRLLK